MCERKPVPHKHAEVIKAWADGAEVQSRTGIDKEWYDAFNPQWREHHEYRIKPQQSDLERYGVEVGDVWLMDDKLKLFVGGITEKLATVQEVESTFHLTYSVNVGPRFETLLFRRGEVNKL